MYETRGRRSAFVGNPQPCGLPQANTWGSGSRLKGRPREPPLGFGFVLLVTSQHHQTGTLPECNLHNHTGAALPRSPRDCCGSKMAGRQLRFGYFFFWSPLTQTIKFVVWIAQTSPPNRPKRVFEQHRQEIERIAA